MEFSDSKKNIVVLGGGFGGLQAALRLGHAIRHLGLGAKYRVTLVDKRPRHVFTPLLYEVATTSEASATAHQLEPLVAYPLKELLENSGVEFRLDEVLHLDIAEGVVHLKNGKLRYEYLVIALGGETNYYRIPGLEAHGLPLKTFEDALAIRERLDPRVGEKKGLTRVVIGGAGSTGVELAGEIREWSCEQPHANTCNVHVTLIESGPSILGALEERTQIKAEARLKQLGVQIVTEEHIARVDIHAIHLEGGEKINYDVFIWTGGVKAASLTERLPMKREGKGRIEIAEAMECIPESPDLRVAGNIYAVGDIACLYDPETGAASPWMARPAMMGGRVAAKNIIARIKFAEGMSRAIKTFTYRVPEYPYIVPVGGKYAVAKIGPFVIAGFLAWILKGVVELNYLLSIMPWWRALAVWLRGFFLFIRNDRMG
ncbi:MAG: FAD-dependent oxidoreductase [Candidatus Jorgensenbacteria bacterium]|nr:FAD-dependent oxidoreductase [Candidatus Jorgensenbacteria bacterium]